MIVQADIQVSFGEIIQPYDVFAELVVQTCNLNVSHTRRGYENRTTRHQEQHAAADGECVDSFHGSSFELMSDFLWRQNSQDLPSPHCDTISYAFVNNNIQSFGLTGFDYQCQSIQNVLHRVHGHTIQPDNIVQMRPCASSRVTDKGDNFAALYMVSLFLQQL